MRAMTHETLSKILSDAPGVTRGTAAKGDTSDPGWTFEAEHRATLYLACEGVSTQVGEVAKILPRPTHLRVETRDRTVHLFPLELLQTITVRPPRDAGGTSKTGF
jgi:hypothetical protein